jgi:molecular chaperone HscA
LGGEDIDQHLIDTLAAGPAGQHLDWPKLAHPPDVGWRVHKAQLRHNVRAVKEALSYQMAATVFIPGINVAVQLTCRELNDLIWADVQAAVEVMAATIAAAGHDPQTLAGVFLVGGSSRFRWSPTCCGISWACAPSPRMIPNRPSRRGRSPGLLVKSATRASSPAPIGPHQAPPGRPRRHQRPRQGR